MSRFPILVLVLSCATTNMGDALTFRSAFTYQNTVDLGDIEVDSLLVASESLRGIVKSGAKDVTIRIDSGGGSIVLGNRWLRFAEDLKKTNGLHVSCVVDGFAASMAAVILESPLCDSRLATQRSIILFHNGSSGARGTVEEMKQAGTLLGAFNESMALVVAARLGVSVAVYQAKIANGDWAMSVTEALSVNVLDAVVSPNEIAPPREG